MVTMHRGFMATVFVGVLLGIGLFIESGWQKTLSAKRTSAEYNRTMAVQTPSEALAPEAENKQSATDRRYTDLSVFREYLSGLGKGAYSEEFRRLLVERSGMGDFDLALPGQAKGAGDPFVRLLLESWAELAPLEALKAIESVADLKSDKVRFGYENIVVSAWAVSDSASAWRWMTNSLDSFNQSVPGNMGLRMERVGAVYDTLFGLGRFQEAASLIKSSTDSTSAAYTTPFVKQWFAIDAKAAAQWMSGLTGSLVGSYAQQGLGGALAGPDSDAALASAVFRTLDPLSQFRFASGYTGALRLAGKRGDALNWIVAERANNPQALLDHATTTTLAIGPDYIFANGENAAVERAAITGMLNPEARAEVATRFSAKISAAYPNEAIQTLAEALAPSEQLVPMARIFTNWASYDYQAATKYLQTNAKIDAANKAALQTAISAFVPRP